ncbi:hypothetical protein ACKVWC_009444 [Pyricularia oryzae]|nr:hypothetical protein MCOR26_004351 [Pyricularia oryzae]KAI6339051.1 hypothetical protein MCOR28_007524 [Pyricularia oryzae]KAI6360855.1 hypothetical protein MCOR31_008936 [Pyricularia oryzae]KAI6397851.1 hypothetical protein MCOR24_008918 [Pyricularia oryzae]KAI6459767.1 hypothetical protein MCOR15_005815 [Pyricularia oryzae]
MDFPFRYSAAILGAGPAGFALAADLQNHGTETLVYSHPEHQQHARQVQARGCLAVDGVFRCVQNVHITTDMAEAVQFSRILVLAVPSSAQESILQLLRPFDLSQHTIIAVPGNLFSLVNGLRVANVLETNLSPYSCRMDDQGRLLVFGKKKRVFIAALHRDRVRYSEVQAVFPRVDLRWCTIIEACLCNINGTFHPPLVLLNAGRIEDTAGDFLSYRDGLTRSVANAMEAIDLVRSKIGAAFGLHIGSSLQISNECYDQHFEDLVDRGRHSPPHNKLRAPPTIRNRNISEDVADLLVAWHCLAQKLGIDASPITAVIVMAQMVMGEDYMRTGRNLAKLKLEHVSRDELVRRFAALPVGAPVVMSSLGEVKASL